MADGSGDQPQIHSLLDLPLELRSTIYVFSGIEDSLYIRENNYSITRRREHHPLRSVSSQIAREVNAVSRIHTVIFDSPLAYQRFMGSPRAFGPAHLRPAVTHATELRIQNVDMHQLERLASYFNRGICPGVVRIVAVMERAGGERDVPF